jgi:hypothetical protein
MPCRSERIFAGKGRGYVSILGQETLSHDDVDSSSAYYNLSRSIAYCIPLGSSQEKVTLIFFFIN